MRERYRGAAGELKVYRAHREHRVCSKPILSTVTHQPGEDPSVIISPTSKRASRASEKPACGELATHGKVEGEIEGAGAGAGAGAGSDVTSSGEICMHEKSATASGPGSIELQTEEKY